MRYLVKAIAVFLWLIALGAAAAHVLKIRMPLEWEARLGGPELYETHFALFQRHSWSTYLHVVFGGVLAVLIPFQLSRRLRYAYLPVHRAFGVLFFCSGMIAVSTGVYLATAMPFGGVPETLAVLPMAAFFVWCLLQALRSVLAGAIDAHRRWVARAVAITLSVATQRVLFSIFLQFPWWSAPTAFWVALAIAPALNLVVTEWFMSGAVQRRLSGLLPSSDDR